MEATEAEDGCAVGGLLVVAEAGGRRLVGGLVAAAEAGGAGRLAAELTNR